MAFHNAQQHKHYGQLHPEEAALQIHENFQNKAMLQEPPRFPAFELLGKVDSETDFCSVLKFGLSLDVILKVVLRSGSLHALWRGGEFLVESKGFSRLARAAAFEWSEDLPRTGGQIRGCLDAYANSGSSDASNRIGLTC